MPRRPSDPRPGSTGDASVDAVVDRSRAGRTARSSEHVAVFERAHEQLRRALDGSRRRRPVERRVRG